MKSKYDTLNALQQHLPVPRLTALSDADFRILWRDYGEREAAIAELLRTVHVTAAAFLDQHIARIAALADLEWSERAGSHLLKRLDEVGLAEHARLAVRSSASVEDGERHSFAGIFSTRLDVQGLEPLKAAILEVWRSGVSRAAIVERVRAGNAGMRIGMTVILQRMVDARFAGVAFSADPVTGKPETWIELVESLGDAMVSGVEKGHQARLTEDGWRHAASLEAHRPLLMEVAALAHAAADAIGVPADIEWASDGHRLWLLQARPITTVAGTSGDAGPRFEWVPLYASDDEALVGFRPMPAFAQYFRSKRKPLADFAAQHEVPAGRAVLVSANRAGFATAHEQRDALLAEFGTPEIVLDFSDGVRQQILPHDALLGRLDELLGEHATSFVVREFVAGEIGLITQACEDGSVVCEWSADGLLAINRGIAATSTTTLSGGAAPGVDDAQRLFFITREAVDTFGPIQLEWVRVNRRLHLIDFSPLATLAVLDDADEVRIISPGFADGLPVVVGTDSHLEDISVSATVSINAIPSAESLGPALARLEANLREHAGQAIIVSPRPYAALAALIPHARGFVFEQASMLCHLSILLREHGVPAVESARLYHLGLSGARVTFAAAQAA
ncbi:PEP/pyruvate-binding domain-containing protein [Burkholderia catarinensis]|uniref:PEP/pyruvate-binding domain-containing protein n=1 Tax=Burkholderia catarinensis TaxID=1108140 RepID=UPI000923150D|nr:PEP/pyruvate-binding domain-containing protein [Burkholderia catarinensis]KAG8148789.1 phosphoenolpyruvate synthase [Burkholderia catarinensis]